MSPRSTAPAAPAVPGAAIPRPASAYGAVTPTGPGRSDRGRRARRALGGFLSCAALAVLVPLTSGQATAAGPALTPDQQLCSAPAAHAALAAHLSQDIADAIRDRDDAVSLTVRDANTGLTCAVHAGRHFDSASAIKATIMGAVLRRAQEQHRSLTRHEAGTLHSMITYSDNDAATSLWLGLGRARIDRFLAMSGMDSTEPGPSDLWGLTQITATDEMRMLDVLTDRQDVLDAHWRAYGLRLMAGVTPSQRWGTPHGAPDGVSVHNKNGWLPRATRGWRVHSLGIFPGGGRDYRMVVLTDENGTMDYGVETIERVAEVVHQDGGGAR